MSQLHGIPRHALFQAHANEVEAATNGAPTYPRVLLVEDEATLRRVIARNLTSRGVEVCEAATAAEALAAVESERPNLLLLDINLPDRSGWDVLRVLRQQGITLPTIVVSAVRANPIRLAEFQPLAYLPKPFPLEALLRLVLGPAESLPPDPVEPAQLPALE